MGKDSKKKSSTPKVHTRRNPELAKGINRYGRNKRTSNAFRFWKLGAKGKKLPKKEQPAAAKAAEPRWYAADDVRKPIPTRSAKHRPTRLRASIKPGTVLILLAGRFRGKRVVFLKQLPSGLLLITGPYKINGVPLRRVNQAYVIATQTTVDVSKADTSSISDESFKKTEKKKKKDEPEFFANDANKKTELSEERKKGQKTVDSAVLPAVQKVPDLAKYLNAKFSLTNGQRPHLMKF